MIVLTMPPKDKLNPVKVGRRPAKRKAEPVVSPPSVSPSERLPLRELIRQVNSHKAELDGDLCLSVLPDGRLNAIISYT